MQLGWRTKSSSLAVLFVGLVGCNNTVVQSNDRPPSVSILFPQDEAEYAQGDLIDFQARVDDDNNVTHCVVTWASTLSAEPLNAEPADSEGILQFSTASLEPGINVISVQVVDESGGSGEDSVSVVIRSLDELDADGDGFAANENDCDDTNSSVYPGAPESGNGVDDDCDGITDEGTPLYDDDGDGYSETDGDCDDGEDEDFPGALETCDGSDNDCDGVIDEETPCSDDDGDGFPENGGDCNDENPSAYPGGTEYADGLDNDCDGFVDEETCATDYDLDGYCVGPELDPSCPVEDCVDGSLPGDCDDGNPLISPVGTESCDGVDQDCDGIADEEDAYGCTDLWEDVDGDNFGVGDPRCLCGFDGNYRAFQGGDCYDMNPSVFPGQLAFFTANRGDGGYDYDCNGNDEIQFDNRFDGECGFFEGGFYDCYIAEEGWEDGVAPACGNTAKWINSCCASVINDCACGWFCCSYDGPSNTQGCR